MFAWGVCNSIVWIRICFIFQVGLHIRGLCFCISGASREPESRIWKQKTRLKSSTIIKAKTRRKTKDNIYTTYSYVGNWEQFKCNKIRVYYIQSGELRWFKEEVVQHVVQDLKYFTSHILQKISNGAFPLQGLARLGTVELGLGRPGSLYAAFPLQFRNWGSIYSNAV